MIWGIKNIQQGKGIGTGMVGTILYTVIKVGSFETWFWARFKDEWVTHTNIWEENSSEAANVKHVKTEHMSGTFK